MAYGKSTFQASDYQWVNQVIIYPAYNPSTLAHDIALLELVTVATGDIQILHVPKTPQMSYEHERPTVSGWGAKGKMK